jgi:hypothetical protein
MSDFDSIDQRVQKIREAVLARHGLSPSDRIPGSRNASAIEDVQHHAVINAHWGIASDIAIVGPVLVLFRRALRILLRWYINPIVEQQNRFNQATVRALYELRLENENLRAEVGRQHVLDEHRAP